MLPVDKEIPFPKGPRQLPMLPIDKEIPFLKGTRQFPLSKMEVGDSFFVPEGDLKRVASNAYGYGHRHGSKFSVRTVPGGVRVWRTD